MKKTYIFIICIAFIALVSFILFQEQNSGPVAAGNSHNVYGWAWSENIGWLSFNCTNCEGNAECDKTAACSGLAYDYGVNIGNDGELSGYAWSRGADEPGGVGWISFNKADLAGCPQVPCRAWIDLSTGWLYGWARAVSGYSGWSGWIRLRGLAQDGSPYGAWLDFITKEFWGFAWGETAIGWISFNLKNCDSDGDGITDNDENEHCSPGIVLPPVPPGVDDAVKTTFGFPPSATGLQTSLQDVCALTSQYFQWQFEDPDSSGQKAYRLQVDFNGNWNDNSVVEGEVDTGYVESSARERFIRILVESSLNQLKYSTNYSWRVMVWDEDGNASQWATGTVFATPAHKAPQPVFDSSPEKPTKDEWVIFDDQATCYDNSNNEYFCRNGGASIVYAWDFDFKDPPGLTTDYTIKGGNASTTYSALGSYVVKFQITDLTLVSPNNVCPAEKTILIRPKLPTWEETGP